MSRELIILTGLSFGFALFLTLFIFWIQHMRDVVPRYKRRLPVVRYWEDTIQCLKKAYHVTGNIEGTLRLASRKCRQKKARKRFRAAESYLKDSRYRDYETALYLFASDGSSDCKNLFVYIIELEVQKNRGLPMRKRSEEESNEKT